MNVQIPILLSDQVAGDLFAAALEHGKAPDEMIVEIVQAHLENQKRGGDPSTILADPRRYAIEDAMTVFDLSPDP